MYGGFEADLSGASPVNATVEGDQSYVCSPTQLVETCVSGVDRAPKSYAVDYWYGDPVDWVFGPSGSEVWHGNEIALFYDFGTAYPPWYDRLFLIVTIVHELNLRHDCIQARARHGRDVVPILRLRIYELRAALPGVQGALRRMHIHVMFILARKVRFCRGEEPEGRRNGVSSNHVDHEPEDRYIREILDHDVPSPLGANIHNDLYTMDAVQHALERSAERHTARVGNA